MTQPAKSHDPSMEEILASIRRIIADDDVKPESAEPRARAPPPAAKALAPATVRAAARPRAAQRKPAPPPPNPPEPKPVAPPAPASNNQDDIDALLAGLDADTSGAEVRPAAP